jgi:hypothetical protein
MAHQAVAWAYRDVFTAAKAAQMEENLRVHDHYTAGQGASILPRETASGTITYGNGGLASGATEDVVVNLPAGRFATAPKVTATVYSGLAGRLAIARGATASQVTIRATSGVSAIAAGSPVTVHWIAVER